MENTQDYQDYQDYRAEILGIVKAMPLREL